MKNLIVCMGVLIGFLGCEHGAPDGQERKRALVIYTGEPEVDGCGYVLRYQKDSLELFVTYEIDPAGFLCGDLPVPVTTIRLIRIES